MPDLENIQRTLAVARGERPADLLFAGGRIINVYSGIVQEHPVAVYNGIIIGFDQCDAREIIDLNGMYLAPGFIESHIHIESSKLTPVNFAEVSALRGTTTVIADPHEIANVMGLDGIRYMLENGRKSLIDIYCMLPSCVPATDMETSGAVLGSEELRPLLAEPGVLGIGEMMNYPGAFLGDPKVLSKLALSDLIDGHAPGLSGKNLSAYIISGPGTDHECFTLEEAREKLSKGMRIMIREGSTAKNLEALLPLITPQNERRMMFVSDDRRAGDLLKEGHLDHILKTAVKNGLNPLTAIRMVTLNPADAFGLRDRGGIKPGAVADFAVIEDLQDFNVDSVWKNGKKISRRGRIFAESGPESPADSTGSLNVPTMTAGDFAFPDKGRAVRVIGIIPDQIITRSVTARLTSVHGMLTSDTSQDIVKLVVVERYTGNGGRSVGFLQGTGITGGAIASTVAHDSHNIIAAGDDDISIATAVNHLVKIGGGLAAVARGRVIADLPLPVAGLMSNNKAESVSASEDKLIEAGRELKCKLSDPYMALSFLALPVIPSLKLTDKGLVDVDQFKIVSVYAD